MVDVICMGEPLVAIYGTSGHNLQQETEYRRTFGGDTSNCALALAKLGHRVGYITRVGADPFGRSFLDLWTANGVDTSHVTVDLQYQTGMYFSASSDAQHDFVYYRKNSAASCLTPADIDEAYIKQAKILHASGISQAISSTCTDAVFAAMACAKTNGVKVSYDFNYRPALWSQELARAIATHTINNFADILFVTEEELHLITSHSDCRQGMREILDAGVELIAVKLGADGCYLATPDDFVAAPAYPVDVVDTVGAGDAFAAAVLVGVLEEMPLKRIARFATTVASLTCRGVGSVQSQPTRKEVDRLLQS